MSLRENPEHLLIESYDTGTKALPWKDHVPKQALTGHSLTVRDLLEMTDPRTAVESLDPWTLYLAILEHGPEDSLEILPMLSKEQVTAILDFEAWTEDDRLSLDSAKRWLDLFKSISTTEMARRYKDLEEEYQIALLNPFVEIVDQDIYENLSSNEQDQLYSLPGQELHYRIKSDDKDIHEFITDLMDGMMQLDLNYAFSLLAHASAMPPNEDEERLRQFRKARLEEYGFVSFDEANATFRPLFEAAVLETKWQQRTEAFQTKAPLNQSKSRIHQFFLDDVLSVGERDPLDGERVVHLQQAFIHLANAMTTSCKIAVDDFNMIRKILVQTKALISLGLEMLSLQDPIKAWMILNHEHPKTLFRYSLSLIHTIRIEALNAIADKGHTTLAKSLENMLHQLKFGQLLNRLDVCLLPHTNFEANEVIKGLFNRFPLVTLEIERNNVGKPSKVIFQPVDSLAAFNELKNTVKLALAEVKVAQ